MPAPIAQSTDHLVRQRAITLALLEHLTRRFDLELDPRVLEGLDAPPPAADMPAWSGGFSEMARAAGLRVSPWSGTCEEAMAVSRHDLPLLTRSWTDWLVLGGLSLRGVEVVRPATRPGAERMSAAGLAAVLGVDPGAQVEWLIVEPLAPAHTLIGQASAEGAPPRPPMERLRSLLHAEREDIAVLVIYSVGVGLLALATPLAAQVLINTVAFASLRQPIVLLALVLLACLALAAGLKALQRYAVEVLQRRVFVRMVADLSWRLPRVRLEAFDKANGPELVNRFFDVLTLQKAANALLLDALGAVLQAAVGLLLLALYHPLLLAFDLFLLAGVALVVGVLGAKGAETAIKESKAKYAVAGWLEELAARRWTFKSAGGPELALLRADELARDYLRAREKHFHVYFRQYAGMLGFQALAATALLGGGGWLVVEGQLTLGQLVAAEIIVASALAGLVKFIDKLETWYDLIAALDKLGQLVDLPLERQLGLVAPVPEGPARLDIDGVSHAIGRPLLHALDLSVEPGARLAILGADGSGKSLLADLCGGLRVPDAGDLRLDGASLRELRPADVREQVALARAPEAVMGTILDNVRLGRPRVSRDDARRALEAVELLHVVLDLPQGLDTPLLPGGAPLSEHQLNRLMIARAIAGRPRLLIIDGLLDGLRSSLRVVLMEALTDPARPWTLLLLTRDRDIALACPQHMKLERGALTPLRP